MFTSPGVRGVGRASALVRRWGGSAAGGMSWGHRWLLAGSGCRKPGNCLSFAPVTRGIGRAHAALVCSFVSGLRQRGPRGLPSENLAPLPSLQSIMPPKKASTQKGKGRDPQLSQLLRLVLEKLGSEDTSEVIECLEKEVGRVRGSHPKRSHVAPSAAFPPVKRRKNGKGQVPATINLTPPTAVSLPAQLILPDTPALPAVPPPAPPALTTDTTAPPGMCVEGVLSDIRKSLVALAPTAQSGASPTPFPGLAVPTPSGPLPVRLPEHQAQDQDPSRLALLEVSKLLAGINAPATTAPPPTTPWGLNDSWQNTVTDLERQVDSLVAAHTSNPLQASNSSPSVTPARAPVSLHPLWFKTSCPAPARFWVRTTLLRKGLQIRYYPDQNTAVVARKLEKERALGRLAGPFKCPLLTGFVCSPMGVVPKKEPGQFRLIHNLSAPLWSSVNDAIDPQLCSVRYASVDNAEDKVRALGRGALLAKTDIESAFRLLPVHPDDYHLLGFQFQGEYYYDQCMPIGCSISCSYFEQFISFLQCFFLLRTGHREVIHYLDDFLILTGAGGLSEH
ncbi:hypothetical protein NDU88_001642 [Pleurodeles waltl]|uniref:ribonuclease H n=1 Tax=Pleurodeles waltl TaxID=8319 RepID=A0AAV7R8K9_PLEWA|nr:hypothetical protein NDU88_001642 [Pleurodeles waltl]